MADSGSVRTLRWKRHKAGDHSLCRNCAALRGQLVLVSPPSARKPLFDPQAGLRDLASDLQVAYAMDPGNANIARELRMTLQALMGAGEGRERDSDLAELFDAFGGA